MKSWDSGVYSGKTGQEGPGLLLTHLGASWVFWDHGPQTMPWCESSVTCVTLGSLGRGPQASFWLYLQLILIFHLGPCAGENHGSLSCAAHPPSLLSSSTLTLGELPGPPPRQEEGLQTHCRLVHAWEHRLHFCRGSGAHVMSWGWAGGQRQDGSSGWVTRAGQAAGREEPIWEGPSPRVWG